MADEELSLHDELSKIYEESHQEDTGDEQDQDDKESQQYDTESVNDQESNADSQEEKSESPDANDNTEERDQDLIEPPQHWSAADKETFAKSPREVQEWALRRDKEMTADYTRKTQEISNFRKTWEPLNELFAPHIAQGANPAAIIQGWAQVANNLQQNPQQAIQQLAKQYNIDLSTFGRQNTDDIWGDEQKQAVEDPRLTELQQTVQQLTGHLQQRDQMEAEAKVKTFENEIRSFAEQKTESGTLAHPHFDELLPDMVTMAQAVRANGQQPALQDLYDKALWANPSTRQKVMAAQQEAAAKKAQDEAIAKAKKAKHASKSGGGRPSGSVNADMSLREMIESQF